MTHIFELKESLAVSCINWDRDCRSQSLIFFEQFYMQLAVKVCQSKLTMSPSKFLFRTKIDSTDLDIRMVNQL